MHSGAVWDLFSVFQTLLVSSVKKANIRKFMEIYFTFQLLRTLSHRSAHKKVV